MGVLVYNIEKLAKHHDRANFDCGNDPLNRYLVQYANQHSKKGLSKTYVLIDDSNPNQILGFYSISANAFNGGVSGYPSEMNLPCVLLGRLAIASHTKGQGLGNYLVINALETIKRLANDLGIAVVMVELNGLHLVPFYAQFGFVQTTPNSLTMYMKVSDI